MQAREAEEGLSEEAAAEMDAKRAALSEARKARDPNLPGLASAADLERLTCALSQPLHSPAQPGVLALALAPTDAPNAEPPLVATGTPRRLGSSARTHAPLLHTHVLVCVARVYSGGRRRHARNGAGGADHAVQLLDPAQQVVAATLAGHTKKVTALTFAGPRMVVSGSADKTVRTWRAPAAGGSLWELAYTFEVPAAVVAVRCPRFC
jgi:hypothetical protein